MATVPTGEGTVLVVMQPELLTGGQRDGLAVAGGGGTSYGF